MRVHTRFLDQWNINYTGKSQDWWALESLKKTIPLNALPYPQHLQFLRKTESNTIRVFVDLRKLKLLLKRHSFPISNIGKDKMIHLMEGFTFVTEFDLNMSYYNIKLEA
jgi:hypothetical protein